MVIEQLTKRVSRGSSERVPAKIKVIGVGDGGCNSVRRMLTHKVPDVQFTLVDTDFKSLDSVTKGTDVLQIGENLTHGSGTNGDVNAGARAARESSNALHRALKNSELVFIAAGMGGGTGSGAAPYVAELARGMGALVVGVVTTPFKFEGSKRQSRAIIGVVRLLSQVDSLIVVDNDRLLHFVHQDADMEEAFRAADEVIARGIMGICESINIPGLVNVDLADVRSVMASGGGAFMALGTDRGNGGVLEAARQAINHPLLDASIGDVRGAIFFVNGADDLAVADIHASDGLVKGAFRKDAKILFGVSTDDSLGDVVKLTLIATGLEPESVVESVIRKARC